MKKTVVLPALKKDLKSATLCAWLVEPGEAFHKGDTLCEVEAEKVVCPIEAASDGVLIAELIEEGDEVAVGAPLAEVECEA